MAHNLGTADGKTAMMYTGEVRWHRLGTKLDEPATAEEAIEAAGLRYGVELRPLTRADGLGLANRFYDDLGSKSNSWSVTW